MDADTIESYLRRYGWDFRRHAETLLMTGFSAGEDQFPLLIQLAHPWVRLTIPVYLPEPPEAVWPDLARALLTMNGESRWGCFGLDQNGHVIVCLDAHAGAGLSYADFEAALDTISYLAEAAYPPLSSLVESGQRDAGDRAE